MYGYKMAKPSTSSENLVDPEHQTRTHTPVSKCRYFLMGLATTLFATAVALAVFQATSDPFLLKRPKIAADQQGLQDPLEDKGVIVASGAVRTTWPDPPPHDQVAKVARYIVHTSDWATVATFSTQSVIEGYPFGNILSMSDGPIDKSSGTPYMYLTRLDFTALDLEKDNRASLTMTEAQSDYCHKKEYDPEDPRCARILITGEIVKVENGTAEWGFAEAAMFSRHPVMKTWPADHKFFFAKMNIMNIYVLDFFGGAAKVDINEYFSAAIP
ncbi:protein CREG1-like [Penaeus japonicus]|uniref:protein CREG1-like n=2 Tax=Penaeus japonicus TaxID=27405 RepID=UPI001C7142C2|nr:protein CREG1-like [Penaeus japonicus]